MLIAIFITIVEILTRKSSSVDGTASNLQEKVNCSPIPIIIIVIIALFSLGCMIYYLTKKTEHEEDEHLMYGLYGVIILLVVFALGFCAVMKIQNSPMYALIYVLGLIACIIGGSVKMTEHNNCDSILEGAVLLIGCETYCIVWALIGFALLALCMTPIGLIAIAIGIDRV